MKIFGTSLLLAAISLASCSKKPVEKEPAAVQKPGVTVQFRNMVNGEDLVLKTGTYTNANGDTFNVDVYRYYISNIKLIGIDGKEFSETESYHLIDQDEDSSLSFTIKDVDANKYNIISFLIGVDSARNVSGAQTGALDLAHGMYWDWNSGYIMAKLEGRTPNSDSKYITFHTGGYKGEYSVIRKVVLSLPKPANTTEGHTPVIKLQSDIGEWFRTPEVIKFSEFSLMMSPGIGAAKIADNYADMFRIEGVE